MSTLYRDFELNDFQETPWYDREIALFKDIINLLPANGETYVNAEHYHSKLVSPDGTVDPIVVVDNDGDMTVNWDSGVALLIQGSSGNITLNGGSGDCDLTVNWDSGVALFCQGSNGYVGVGHNAPVAPLHVLSSVADGQELANTVLSVEGGTNGGIISILSDEGVASYIHFADAWLVNGADIKYDTDPGTGAYSLSLLMSNKEYLRVGSDATSYEVVINEGSNDVNTRVESNGLTHAFFVDGGLNMVAIGHGVPDRLLHIEQDTATTDAVQRILRIAETCSGTVADGFGVGMEFELETASQATNYIAGTIDVLWEDETEGDSDMIFKVADGWTVYEALRLNTSDGGMIVSVPTGTLDWSANQIAAFGVVDGNFAKQYPIAAATGGLSIRGYTKGAAAAGAAIWADAFVENDPTDEGAFHIRARKHDGAGALTTIGATGKVFAIENNTSTCFEILGDGGIMYFGKSGTDQANAGAAAGEIYQDTNDDNTLKVGV